VTSFGGEPRDKAGARKLESAYQFGVAATYTYDANGNVASTVDTLGRTTAITYDAAGHVASSSDGQTTTSFAYDAANRLVTSTDALGNATTYGYTLGSCGCSEDDLLTSIHTPDLPSGVAWTHGRTYPVPTSTGWAGPSLLAGSASGAAATTSLTGTLNPGDYQIGTDGYDAARH
jgi:YD repeat-containing protein